MTLAAPTMRPRSAVRLTRAAYRPVRGARRAGLPGQLGHHALQQPAGTVDADIRIGVEPGQRTEAPLAAVDLDGDGIPDPDRVEAADGERLLAGDLERGRGLACEELQRQDAERDQVRAVDALVALGYHGPNAEQGAALRRPVARAARPVLAARDHDQGHTLGLVAHGGVVDRHLLAVREVAGEAAL